jgi:integrase
MGHIKTVRLKSGKVRYQAAYRDTRGREHAKRFETKREANAWLAREAADMQRGSWRDPRLGRVTFANWVEYYLEGAVHKRATTLARDRQTLRAHFLPRLGSRPLAAITPLEVRSIVQEMASRLAPATVRTNYGVLRAVFSAAVDADVIATSPCRGIDLAPDDRRDRPVLTAEQLRQLADAMPPEYRAIVYLAGALGLRWSEIAGLRVGRVDFLARTLTVTETVAEVEGQLVFSDVKTRSSRRTMTVPTFVLDVLAEHLARRGRPGPEALVFVDAKGNPLRGSNFRARVWHPALRSSALEGLTFHGLRHSATGVMIQQGTHPRVIQERLGHSSARISMEVYGHVPAEVDKAAAKELDSWFSDDPRSSRGAAGTSEPEA